MPQHGPRILLTGGAGYIGSHTAAALRGAGFEPVILDNFANSHPAVLGRLERITGRACPLEQGDVLDTAWVASVLRRHRPDAIVHFAGLKAVGESVAEPLRYYHQNVGGALSLLRAVQEASQGDADVPAILFSSTATVYGDPSTLPVREDAPLAPSSPYAETKLAVERMLQHVHAANPRWRTGILRYFNPVGAHPSGLIGEDPSGIPNNLMPFISQVAVGLRPHLNVFGNDYPTPDGTGVRDYIHAEDLARGHVAAVKRLLEAGGSFVVNLGTGRGYSVLEVLHAFERACGRSLPHKIIARRPGDVAEYYADPSLAKALLGWEARHGLEAMCADAWRWQQGNPRGYAGA